MKLLTVALDRIQPNPNQPRKHFDPTALAQLAASIKARGVLQPIVIRPSAVGVGNYEIIAGERRYHASRLAGCVDVPAMVREGDDDDEAFILAVLENVGRAEMKPIEEAHAYAQIAAMGRSVDEIAEIVGAPAFRVAWRLELLNLAPEYQELDLPRNVARLLSRMTVEGQRSAMRRYMGGEFKTTQECERFCNAVINREASGLQDSGLAMFGAAELDGFGADAPRREQARVNRNAIAGAWERVTKIADAFGPIDAVTPHDIADALAGDLARYLAETRALEAHARRARIALETAAAIQAARL